MKTLLHHFLFVALLFPTFSCFSQRTKVNYHPCFLKDSVEAKLSFIELNASRIFTDTVDCKQELLDNIATSYSKSKDKKYLDVLSVIRQNQSAKVEELYTDIIKRFAENDFSGFINELYTARGKYAALEKELIITMNMIVGTKPLKQKFLGSLNIEIEKAKDKKDSYKLSYLQKLKSKIEEEKY